MTKAEGTEEKIGGYRVVRRLATGGTSDVLLAKAEGPLGFERTVVLKVLLSQFQEDDGIARMFAREASAYARLAHPAIVRLFDFFAIPSSPAGQGARPESRAGQLVMVLEHVDGPSLSRLKSMLKAAGKHLDDRAAFFVMSRVFDALAAAHATVDDGGVPAPVIHRDVNPSNVLVPWDGEVKLADFGVAKVTGLEHHSVAGMIKGTYGYMAPEQVKGENVTPRADVYAAAIILWELLTKRKAFQRGALPEIDALRAMAEPRLPSIDTLRPDVDKNVREALKRALEPRAERRTITAEEMVAVLGAVVPADEGRERLVAALELVRKDSRAAAVAEPPAPPREPPLRPSATQKAVTQLGLAPPPPPVPKPGGASVPRMPAVVPAAPAGPRTPEPPRAASQAKMPAATPPEPPRAASQAKMPAATPPEPPRATSQAKLPAVTAPAPPKSPSQAKLAAVTVPEPPKAPSASKLLAVTPPRPPPPKRPSAAQRLAATAPDTTRDVAAAAATADELAETAKRAPYDGPKLFEAIDEVLKGVPSSMPPSVIREASHPPQASASPTPEKAGDPAPADAARPSHKIGEIPPAPPPLQGILQGIRSDAADGARAREQADAPPEEPKKPVSPPTPRMMPAAPASGSEPPLPILFSPPPPPPETAGVGSTALMGPFIRRDMLTAGEPAQPAPAQPAPPPPPPPAQPAAPPAPPPVPAQPAAPPPMPAQPAQPAAPPPMPAQPAQPSPPAPAHFVQPSPPALVPTAASSTPQNASPAYESGPHVAPPRRSAAGIGIAVGLLIVIGAGIAGTIGYVRSQLGPSAATREVPTASAPATVEPPASAGAEDTAGTATDAAVASAEPLTTDAAVANAETPATDAAVATAEPPASAAPTASVAPSSSAAPPASSAPSGPRVPPDMGVIITKGAIPHRRIFVDEKTVGQTPQSVTVKCGQRVVRLGSAGKRQTVDVPCGGEIVVSDK